MHLCRCNSGSLPCYSFWLSFARYDHAVNGSGQCTYAKSNGYIPPGDTGPFGTGERIFCLDQEPLAIKWVHGWSSSFYLLRDKEINSKDTVETLLMKNSLIWTTRVKSVSYYQSNNDLSGPPLIFKLCHCVSNALHQ